MTAAAVRRAIQQIQGSLSGLATRHGINSTTVPKWKNRASIWGSAYGPKDPGSTLLTIEERVIIVAFLGHTLLPVDD